MSQLTELLFDGYNGGTTFDKINYCRELERLAYNLYLVIGNEKNPEALVEIMGMSLMEAQDIVDCISEYGDLCEMRGRGALD